MASLLLLPRLLRRIVKVVLIRVETAGSKEAQVEVVQYMDGQVLQREQALPRVRVMFVCVARWVRVAV